MAWITVNGAAPAGPGAAFVAANATLAGAVRLEEGASVWYGAVLRADTGRIFVGAGSNVQDSAVLHGCTVGDGCLIGMHATVLDGAVVGPGCLIAAGALVPEGAQIPAGSLVMGVPGKVVRPVSAEQAAAIAANEREYRELARQHAEAQNQTEE